MATERLDLQEIILPLLIYFDLIDYFCFRDGSSFYAHKSLFVCLSKLLKELFKQDDCCSCNGKKCVQRKEPTVVRYIRF